jgi:hypothetical protein
VVLIVTLSGCGGGKGEPAPTPVSGTLTVKGRPAAGATIVFHPKSGAGPKASAQTAANGEFRLTTNRADDGAVPGVYAVTVVWPDTARSLGDGTDDGADRLGGRYRDPANPLTTVTVAPGQTGPVALTVK